MEQDESAMRKFVSPEYKARCIDWAIAAGATDPDKVVEAAEKFYAYVHGEAK